MFYNAPTYNLDTKSWEYTEFATRQSTLKFVQEHIKYPGEYNLKYSEGVWNEQANIFRENKRTTGKGFYPKYPNKSIDFKKHWDFEKEKCAFEGFIIYKSPREGLQYVVPCLFYWYLNYCPIPDKVKQREDFVEIYDGDLHYFLYILEAILVREYAVVLKKRQYGVTLKNDAILLNAIWFGESAMVKMFAYDESKVREAWAFMTKYRDHINTHCGWKRGFEPGGMLDWHIRRKQTDGTFKGNQSQAKGFTTKQNAENGVGGSALVIFGEEAGVNPTLGKTHEFITSNVAYGGLVTGLIIYAGAVGELDKAQDLKEFMIHPRNHGFLSRPNNIEEDLEFGPEVGLFIPEWWNYVSVERDSEGRSIGDAIKCFDKWGNTNKSLALEEIKKDRAKQKKKDPEKYRYYCSQRPLSITEAFAHRKDSRFPLALLNAQERRIKEGQYPYETCDVVINKDGKYELRTVNKPPINEFPLPKSTPDKTGIPQIFERPIKDPPFGLYYASVDPVNDGKTTTSDSLFSIIIWKNDTQVERVKDGEKEVVVELGKIVAVWTGRFDDINKTHERAMGLILIYNAWTLCEANVSTFINYMINQKLSYMLVPKTQIGFLKELGANESSYHDYGWKNTGKMFDNHMLVYGVESLKEVVDSVYDAEGGLVMHHYGVIRVPDLMLIKEMIAYYDGLNVDRLVAYCALMAFVKIQQANLGIRRRVEEISVEKRTDLYKVDRGFFKNINGTPNPNVDSIYKVSKIPFRNLK